VTGDSPTVLLIDEVQVVVVAGSGETTAGVWSSHPAITALARAWIRASREAPPCPCRPAPLRRRRLPGPRLAGSPAIPAGPSSRPATSRSMERESATSTRGTALPSFSCMARRLDVCLAQESRSRGRGGFSRDRVRQPRLRSIRQTPPLTTMPLTPDWQLPSWTRWRSRCRARRSLHGGAIAAEVAIAYPQRVRGSCWSAPSAWARVSRRCFGRLGGRAGTLRARVPRARLQGRLLRATYLIRARSPRPT